MTIMLIITNNRVFNNLILAGLGTARPRQEDHCNFEADRVYTVSSRTACSVSGK